MLTVGIAVGAVVFRDLPHTDAATERPIARTDAPPPVIPAPVIPAAVNTRHPDDAERLGVIFARQSADIVARSEGTLQAVYSNLGDRLECLRRAVGELRAMPDLRFLDASPLYRTEPWEQQPGQHADEGNWFFNCAVVIETELEPGALQGSAGRVVYPPAFG